MLPFSLGSRYSELQSVGSLSFLLLVTALILGIRGEVQLAPMAPRAQEIAKYETAF